MNTYVRLTAIIASALLISVLMFSAVTWLCFEILARFSACGW